MLTATMLGSQLLLQLMLVALDHIHRADNSDGGWQTVAGRQACRNQNTFVVMSVMSHRINKPITRGDEMGVTYRGCWLLRSATDTQHHR